ncbi:hypothetical protein [Burkholderia cepacia]|uniref:hypothetical protein n=1 Tax=Burkholderia cepacia TaxID=292 RepID=UPI00264E3225|nr:hypothetical protein [Burkholderia cepacia]MDN7913708.1 hypothetical protein [Burkholderia cepacia]
MNGQSSTSMPWISQGNYESFRKILIDGATLPIRYEEWRTHVQRRIDMLAAQGHAMVKVDVDPDLFTTWCRERSVPISSQSCSRYAMEVMALRAAREQD